MKKLLHIVMILLLASTLYGAKEENVVFSKVMPPKYDQKVYRKVTVLFTEARLKLQKKYRKYLTFIYDEQKKLSDKKAIKKELKKQNARYYVTLDIKEKKKGCTNLVQGCKVKYVIKVFDGKKNKHKKFSLKAVIKNNEYADISSGVIRSNTSKLVKFMKK